MVELEDGERMIMGWTEARAGDEVMEQQYCSTDNEQVEATEAKLSSSNSDRVGGDNNAGPPRKKIEREMRRTERNGG